MGEEVGSLLNYLFGFASISRAPLTAAEGSGLLDSLASAAPAVVTSLDIIAHLHWSLDRQTTSHQSSVGIAAAPGFYPALHNREGGL